MISAIILTRNNQDKIVNLIGSLKLLDEIVVIDDYSTDRTVLMAKKLGAKVYLRKLNNDFAAQRNFGSTKAKGEWLLFIDSDEIVSRELTQEIIKLVNKSANQTTGYYIKRQDILWNRALAGTEGGKMALLRLIKKGSGKFVRRVHEHYICLGKTEILKNTLLHYPHPDLREFIASINFYSTLHAQENLRERKKSSLFKIICYPWGKFFYNWLVLGGYRDGMVGLIVSLMMALHSFLAWSKLWLMQ